jgi:hypothetical protein
MQSQKTLRRHAALVDEMATARGVDLEEAILRGRLTVPELDDAVLACTGCSRPDACEAWLASRPAETEATPPYCRNADLFAELARR